MAGLKQLRSSSDPLIPSSLYLLIPLIHILQTFHMSRLDLLHVRTPARRPTAVRVLSSPSQMFKLFRMAYESSETCNFR